MCKKPTVVSFYSGNEELEKTVNKIIEDNILICGLNENLEEILTIEKISELVQSNKHNEE